MTRLRHARAVAACAMLVPAFGIMAASAQEVLSPKPMIEHPPVQTRPPAAAPAQNSPAGKRATTPSQAVAGAAAVKPDLTEEFGDWQLRCYSKPNRACQLSQRQVNPTNQALLIWVELTNFVTPKPGWQFVVMLPLGFRLAPTLGIRADDELLLNMSLVTCVSAGCLYSAEMPVAGLETLRKSQKVGTEIVDLKGQRYALNLSMRGFNDAHLKSALVLKGK